VIWSTVTIDDASYAQGFTGASVWGSTPVVDSLRNSLYVSTGNNYTAPSGYTTPGGNASPAGDHFDSVLAVNLDTGKINWRYRSWNGDTWDVATWFFAGLPQFGSANYPPNLGPDWDYGSGPMLISTSKGDILGAGAKSGIFYALNPTTGKELWETP